jgi:hypothetical protein
MNEKFKSIIKNYYDKLSNYLSNTNMYDSKNMITILIIIIGAYFIFKNLANIIIIIIGLMIIYILYQNYMSKTI